MTAQLTKPLPLNIDQFRKSDVRTQFAALCWRIKDGKVQVLLVTSRRTRRWIIPKGWPISDQSPSEAAATEAWEEAGAKGIVDERPLGIFSYVKDVGEDDGLPCVAMVYGLKVKSLSKAFPESDERKRKWMTRKQAAAAVDAPELSRILRDFDPRKQH
ncbi:MAG: NUDIX hydrolase [Rhodobacteraceae bacterium]|nr:NUDIX hydrolase [Paracoccaceae bacterium]